MVRFQAGTRWWWLGCASAALAAACSQAPSFGDGAGGAGGAGGTGEAAASGAAASGGTAAEVGGGASGATGGEAPAGAGAAGAGGAGAGGSGPGAGGAPPACTVDAECPGGGLCEHPVCIAAECALVPDPAGTQCLGIQLCDGAGNCVACLTAADCPGSADPCATNACVGGTCMPTPSPAGTFCNGFDDQCDGNGSCVDCVNNGGCGECCVCNANHVCIQS